MPIVVVQEDGAPEPLREWIVADLHTSEGEVVEERAWADLCHLLVKRAASAAARSRFNVFLVYDEEELNERDRPALIRTLKHARERSWGARLYVVLSNAPPLGHFPHESRADLAAWMKELIAGKVTDVIQVTESCWDRAALHRALRDRATGTAARQKLLRQASGQRPWRCALPANWVDLADILGTAYAITEPDDDSRADLILVLEPPEAPQDSEAEIDRYLSGDGARRRCCVVTHMHWPSPRLKKYCAGKGLSEPIAIRDDFELWYLLLRLNLSAVDEEFVDADGVNAVPLAKKHRLRPSVSEPFPTLLVTSVFDPDEEDQWLIAAQDVGEFLLLAPSGMDYRVELAIDPARLNGILDTMPVVDGWIHMGHGSGERGLWVPNDGEIVPDKWVQCFQDRELRLAMFLTCDSHDIARHFAEQGASVAIGFEGEVESAKARQLALGVLKIMLTEGTRGGSILAGFRGGEARFLAAQMIGDARPKAYHPRKA
jgi:hypothetical protein